VVYERALLPYEKQKQLTLLIDEKGA